MFSRRIALLHHQSLPFALPLAAALALATYDTLRHYSPLPSAFQDVQVVILPALFIVAKFLVTYLVLAPFVVLAPYLIWRSDPVYASVALSLGTCGWFWLAHLEHLGLMELVRRGLPVTLAILAGVFAWNRIRGSEALRKVSSQLLFAAVLVCLELGLFYWLIHFGFRDFFRNAPWFAVAVQAGLVLFALAPLIVARSTLQSVLALVIGLLALLPAAIPFSAEYKLQAVNKASEFNGKIRYVILIVVDTLRADALGYMNPHGTSTPNMDEIASEAIVFENAIAPAPWTFPSMTSLMTGIAPYIDSENLVYRTAPLPTLATLLREEGYVTRGISGNFLLRRPYNVTAGFQEMDTFALLPLGDSRGSQGLAEMFPRRFRAGGATSHLTREAVDWVRKNRDQPFFLWLHYLDPHYPYEPPPEYVLRPGSMSSVLALEKTMQTARERVHLRQLYADEVRFVDLNIGVFLESLKELGIYDEALLILTSDHGEEFWEHGGTSHGHSLHRELLHVPLLFRLPKGSIRKRIVSPVPTQAILPTVLELCGVKKSPAAGWTEPLTALLEPEARDHFPQPIISAGTHSDEYQRSVVMDGHKYIKRLHSGREELYHLATDPWETKSVLQDHPEVAARARLALAEHEKLVAPLRKLTTAPSDRESAETLRRLKTLGYVQ